MTSRLMMETKAVLFKFKVNLVPKVLSLKNHAYIFLELYLKEKRKAAGKSMREESRGDSVDNGTGLGIELILFKWFYI